MDLKKIGLFLKEFGEKRVLHRNRLQRFLEYQVGRFPDGRRGIEI